MKNNTKYIWGGLVALAAVVSGCEMLGIGGAEAETCGLTVCRLVAPANIDRPVFGWKMRSDRKGACQKAYRIVVKDCGGNVVWDSGVKAGGESSGIAYEGPQLKSTADYTWQVTVQDETLAWLKPATCAFSTGLRADEWGASAWIAVPGAYVITSNNIPKTQRAAPGTSCFFKKIINAKDVKKAYWSVTGQGVFEAYVNGEKVRRITKDGAEADFLKPGFTHVFKTRDSFTYDVTPFLKKDAGESNVFSAQVSAGWWRDQIVAYRGRESAFRAVLTVKYQDGSVVRFGTDNTWQGAITGPVKEAAIFDGEVYDARIKTPWMKTGEDAAFKAVKTINEFKGVIVPMEGTPIRARCDLALKPVTAHVWQGVTGASTNAHGKVKVLRTYEGDVAMALKPGETLVIDFGQNAAAVPSFQFAAAKGTVLKVDPAEMLNDENGLKSRGNDGPEGSVYRLNLRKLYRCGAEAVYTFAGEGVEKYMPQFTFFGYRYLSLTSSGEVTIKKIRSVPVTSIARTLEGSSFETDRAELNRLVANVVWGQYSNYLSVPTDCPQRNERLGWTADTQVFCAAATRNADVYGFLYKWMRDMRDTQLKDGSFTGVAPVAQYGATDNLSLQLGWADAGIIVPYTMWRRYGDASIIKANRAAMEKYLALVEKSPFTTEAAMRHQWADWLSYEDLESASGRAYKILPNGKREIKEDAKAYWRYLGGCYWIWDARMMAEMMAAIGDDAAQAKYAAMAQKAYKYVMDNFIDKKDGRILPFLRKMQTPALFAIKFGLITDKNALEVTKKELLDNIREHGDCLQTGFLGTSILMDTLTYNVGSPRTAYTLLLQHKNPSWLYSVDQGATTIWERWNSYRKDTGFGPVGMNSFNHYAYGAVLDWMYGTMAGIRTDEKTAGYKHFILAPIPDLRVRHVKAVCETAYGAIRSAWAYDAKGTWVWNFTIPANTSATVILPDGTQKEYVSGSYQVEK